MCLGGWGGEGSLPEAALCRGKATSLAVGKGGLELPPRFASQESVSSVLLLHAFPCLVHPDGSPCSVPCLQLAIALFLDCLC